MNHTHLKSLARSATIALVMVVAPITPIAQAEDVATAQNLQLVRYRAKMIEGVRIAYREAGDPANPTLVLLHGFPTASHIFRYLIPAISAHYHVIAPDHPGFGASGMPPADAFDYSFADLARLMTALLDAMGVGQYAAYVMDYGAPVGYQMFASDPGRVTGFVIQNGNAYEEGLRKFWDPLRAYWANPGEDTAAPLRAFLTVEGTTWQYQAGLQHPDRVSADNYSHVQDLLYRPGNQEVQLELFLS